jgi:two-component system LytT family response regulator
MPKLRTVLVDDEPLAREGLRLHLEPEPDIELIAECADGETAIAAIREYEPDLVFLDVQMPGIDGFGVLAALADAPMPAVVFVTAYDEFALRAFDAHALDYLLKPFDDARFRRALERVRTHLSGRLRRELDARLAALLERMRGRPDYARRLVVRDGGRVVILRTDDVDRIEAAANYVRVHAGGRTYLLRGTMARMEAMLDPAEFVRIHRSTIVRIDRIRVLEPLYQGDFLVVLESGARLPSSRGYRDNLQALLRQPT